VVRTRSSALGPAYPDTNYDRVRRQNEAQNSPGGPIEVVGRAIGGVADSIGQILFPPAAPHSPPMPNVPTGSPNVPLGTPVSPKPSPSR